MQRDDGRVVSNFVPRALQGQDITRYGDDGQTRSCCFVSDLIEGLIKLMESPDRLNGPLNLGNPQEISIGELARYVIDLTDSKSRIVFAPLPQDDPRQRRPDITRAREEIGWAPVTSLEEGFKKTIAYFDDLLCET